MKGGSMNGGSMNELLFMLEGGWTMGGGRGLKRGPP